MKNIKGLTFIEVLIYVSLLSGILTAMFMVFTSFRQAGIKASGERELSIQARYIVERVEYEIRNASGINSLSLNSLSLSKFENNVNPMTIDNSGGGVRIAGVRLNSNDTVASITFENYSSLDLKSKNIRFTVVVDDPGSNNNFQYQLNPITIHGDGEIRSN